MSIYLNISKLLARKKHIKKSTIAETLGVSRNTITNWLSKEVGIKAEQVPQIAKVLHVSVSELFGEEASKIATEEPVLHENNAGQEMINFKLDFMQKELDKKDVRIEELIRENALLKTRKTACHTVAEDGGHE